MLRDILMSQGLITAEPDAKVNEVAKMMSEEDVGSVLILTNGKPRGILTDRDIVLRCIAENLDVNDTTVENIMTEAVETVRDTDGIFDCIRKMSDTGVRRMPVVDSAGNAIGIISFGDLLGVLSREFYALTQSTTPLEELEQRKVFDRRRAA